MGKLATSEKSIACSVLSTAASAVAECKKNVPTGAQQAKPKF